MDSLGSEWAEKADSQSDVCNRTDTLPTESSPQEAAKSGDSEVTEVNFESTDRKLEGSHGAE